ncbi:Dus-domain-containing protein [Athelia psychrophila]|uniref:tRNA-dihydrouridine(16/17) synthase [NAD(P)(+)] n=1 Tax=Athelia psychrophila TaxID=1759441 RepID=A0A166E424_9AGAM|nr:Dus-domain-containing protein [Fibularhizoctonia sp. CBS 109695]
MTVSNAATTLEGEKAVEKLGGYQFYREVLGSPKNIVAPMVDQSELAWRILSRRYGAQLVYTPMINAKMFANEKTRKGYREANFNVPHGEEGGPLDRPLIVQFCANDPQQLLESAKFVAPHCDAVDINLGCPQDIAKKGHYGAFLQDEWELIYELVNTLHKNLSVPVTAKFRVFPTVEKTVEYAKMLERAGAQILTCHGRLREQRGQYSGLADWEKIRAVKEAVSIPVFANGNILYHSDIAACLAATGADGVMSAEGQLYNAALFAPASPANGEGPSSPEAFDTGLHLPSTALALEYLEIVRSLRTSTALSAVKGHLFKLLRPALGRETDLRERLGRVNGTVKEGALDKYVAIVKEVQVRMEKATLEAEARVDGRTAELVGVDGATGIKVLPHWLAQPYFRPLQVLAPKKPKTKVKAAVEDVLDDTDRLRIAAAVQDKVEPDEAVVGKRDRTPEELDTSKRTKVVGDVELGAPIPAMLAT